MATPFIAGPAAAELRTCAQCEAKVLARGLCGKHYQQAYRRDLLPKRERTDPLVSLTAWVPVEMEKAIRKLSRQTGRAFTAIVRDALSKYLWGE